MARASTASTGNSASKEPLSAAERKKKRAALRRKVRKAERAKAHREAVEEHEEETGKTLEWGEGEYGCIGLNRFGEPCDAKVRRGRNYCSAHNPYVPLESRFGSPEQARAAGKLGGRPRKPRVDEVLREMIEDDLMERVIRVYEESLEANQAMALNVRGGGMVLEHVPDFQTRLRAANSLMDRGYGKPVSTNILKGDGDDPVVVDVPDIAEKRQKVTEILTELGVGKKKTKGGKK